jgi:hypothetical protein
VLINNRIVSPLRGQVAVFGTTQKAVAVLLAVNETTITMVNRYAADGVNCFMMLSVVD